MIFFGHRFLASEHFYHIESIYCISKTPSNSTIYLTFDENNLDIIDHLFTHNIKFALHVKNVKELVYAHALGALYITVEKELAKNAQRVANDYLFDAKILAHIDDEDEIEELALNGVDGVIFAKGIIKIST
jgi:hypothetical protein